MSMLTEIAADQTALNSEQVEWLQSLTREGQLVSDLSLADIALWVKTVEGNWVSVALFRPSSAGTVFSRDIVGTKADSAWEALVSACLERGTMVEPTEPVWFEEMSTNVRAIPVRVKGWPEPIAIMTRHSLASEAPTNNQALSFIESAEQIYSMIADGDFPDPSQRPSAKLGTPRPSDGFVKVDRDGFVLYASPNAISAFNRMGFAAQLEGESLAQVARSVGDSQEIAADEAIPMIVSGRVPWRSDFHARGMTIAMRGIPLSLAGERIGAIILLRDVSEIRRQEREIRSKNATIREIHHRVKNNLQTVASLLRIQGRRTKSTEAKEALAQAMRRVEAIAVVHDTLSTGLAQSVNFDEVAARIAPLASEVASTAGKAVRPSISGKFGELPSEYATPLAVVLTELITNAVEHGIKDRNDGKVSVVARRDTKSLVVTVADNGGGIDPAALGGGLGTQIIRTLVENELSGTIEWATQPTGGTLVTIEISLRFVQAPVRK
jgi:two-component sensor histidine kinase